VRQHSVNNQWTYREHSVNIQWTLSEHSVNIQWTFSENSETCDTQTDDEPKEEEEILN
jgi:hypothetical protein